MKTIDQKKQLVVFVLSLVIAFGIGYASRGTVSASWWVTQVFTHTEADLELQKKIDFAPFWEALDKVQNKYVGEVDYAKAVEGAVAGMVASLEDPYSVYIDPDGLKAFNEELNGTFEGIGAEINIKDNKLMIVAPLEESPAQKAGLLPLDQITHIDGEAVTGLSLEQAVKKIRGKGGTVVKLTIIRAGGAPVDISVTRGTINIKSVTYRKEKDMGIIQIVRFDSSTVQLTRDAYDRAVKDGVNGLVLDVRNNPGGYLDAAVGVASLFMEDAVVVQEQYKGGQTDQLRTIGKPKDTQMPLVVIVNEGSASASEILAGALKDHGRARIVGAKTFGKGSVQEVVPLTKGGAIKVTIAKWLTPSGHALDKNGLDPDIVVEWKQAKEGARETDPQLAKALELLRK